MKLEVYEFWNEKDLQIPKLVRIGRQRHGIRTTAIKKAAQHIFDERNGKYRDSWINAWLVFSVAREIDFNQLDEVQRAEAKEVDFLLNRIEQLQAELDKKKLSRRILNWFIDSPLPYWE